MMERQTGTIFQGFKILLKLILNNFSLGELFWGCFHLSQTNVKLELHKFLSLSLLTLILKDYAMFQVGLDLVSMCKGQWCSLRWKITAWMLAVVTCYPEPWFTCVCVQRPWPIYVTASAGMWNRTTTLENCLAWLIKLNVHLSYNQTIPHLGMYPKSMKTYVHKQTC